MAPVIRNHKWAVGPDQTWPKPSADGYKEMEALSWRRKFDRRSHVYQLILGPIFDILRMMGRAPFYRDNSGKMDFTFFSSIMAYSVFINVVASYAVAISIIDLRESVQPKFNNKVKILLAALNIAPQIVTPILHWIGMKNTQKYLILWDEFQHDYEKVTNAKFPSISTLRPKLQNLLSRTAFTIIILFYVYPIYFSDVVKWHFFVGFYFNAVGDVMHFAFWTTTAAVVSKLFEQIHTRLQEEISKDLGYTPKIEQYRLLWIKLSRIVRECGSSISVNVTVFILNTTLNLVLMIYLTIIEFHDVISIGKYGKLIEDVLVIYYCGSTLHIYCNSGYLMSEKCTNQSLENLLLMRKRNTLEEELHLNIFFFTVKHYSAKATISDFYLINRSSFGSIVTSLITYIIVLIQFHTNYGYDI